MPAKPLYDLAIQFRKLHLWKRLGDSELFAVMLPDGSIGYCCVMGALGDHLALAVYPGNMGLSSYRMLFDAQYAMFSLDRTERMLSQDCVTVSFESKADIDEARLAEIKALGLTFRGKNAFPVFQRMRPRHYPWYLTDATDEATLTIGLRAAIEVAHRLEDTRQLSLLDVFPDGGTTKASLGFTEGIPYDRTIPLLRMQADASFAWETIDLPAPIAPVYESPSLADELLLARLKKAPRNGVWECGLFLCPAPVSEEEPDGEGMFIPADAPFFPFFLAAVNHENGLVVYATLAKKAENWADVIVADLASVMLDAGPPQKILVPDARAQSLLAPAMKQAGILVEKNDDLPSLFEAAEDFAENLEHSGMQDEEIEDVLLELEALMERDGASLDDLLEMVRDLQEKGELPATFSKMLESVLDEAAFSKPAQIHSLPDIEAKSYVISVSLGKGCYRHIEISADNTLWDLHRAILDAFDFDDDHMHAFFMDNKAWSTRDSYSASTEYEEDRSTEDYPLRSVGLHPGKAFLYIFDFGDSWRFSCKVLRTVDETTSEPLVIRSVGNAPQQYSVSD